MSIIEHPTTTAETVAELLDQLGEISPQRVRCQPPPGTATEQDVIDIVRRENRTVELIDGVLVEKAMGFRESVLAFALGSFLRAFVKPRKLGVVTGPDGLLKLRSGLVRIPDVAFTSVQRLPGGRVPDEPVPLLVPDLAVEVLSESNTPQELQRKIGEYFLHGVRLVWLVDPKRRSVVVYRSPADFEVFGESDSVNGGNVLPGFSLQLRDLFSELDLL